MRKLIVSISAPIIFLSACATAPKPQEPVELKFGKQESNQLFTKVLNPVPKVVSDKPRDYSLFSLQMNKVKEKSPNLVRRYNGLYQQVENWAEQNGDPASLSQFGIQAAQMGGGDGQGNVLFTGYFSPVMKIRHQADSVYKYPLYGMPNCQQHCPSRAQIYAGALANQGLEIGYSKSLLDNFMLEVQGSGFVYFEDGGDKQYFAYAGKNGHGYTSIGKVLIERGEVAKQDMSLEAIKNWAAKQDESTLRELLEQNPSFVFFKANTELDVIGAAGIPLQGGAAVAADRAYLPMGSVILAEVPQLDAKGIWTGHHVLKLLMVLDTGGAVKKNHLDLYHGLGVQAGRNAGYYKHFGRVWLLTTGQ
ncbi:murein transglycosylase A [Motilimonas cestriensis]|uniref:peptidoglycan lytic exotransglycosylase n=1 Tax=Motilimonas cestriensis TaxID=2742685 RepID=A0ABS8W770_9GAMM|nr:murein transglycosylase A [Motilimonas cestriensis]MCE2594847.1 murein transglycosylase A [Motilimonas cestriensis]